EKLEQLVAPSEILGIQRHARPALSEDRPRVFGVVLGEDAEDGQRRRSDVGAVKPCDLWIPEAALRGFGAELVEPGAYVLRARDRERRSRDAMDELSEPLFLPGLREGEELVDGDSA